MNIRQVTVIEQARSRVVALPYAGPVGVFRIEGLNEDPLNPDSVIETVALQSERVAGQEFVVHPDVDKGVQQIIESLLAERSDWQKKALWLQEAATDLRAEICRYHERCFHWKITSLAATATLVVMAILWWLS